METATGRLQGRYQGGPGQANGAKKFSRFLLKRVVGRKTSTFFSQQGSRQVVQGARLPGQKGCGSAGNPSSRTTSRPRPSSASTPARAAGRSPGQWPCITTTSRLAG